MLWQFLDVVYSLYRSPVHAPECSVYRQLRESLRSTTKSWDKTWRSCLPDLVASVTTIRLYSLKWRYGLLFRPPGLNMFENIFMFKVNISNCILNLLLGYKTLSTIFSTVCQPNTVCSSKIIFFLSFCEHGIRIDEPELEVKNPVTLSFLNYSRFGKISLMLNMIL